MHHDEQRKTQEGRFFFRHHYPVIWCLDCKTGLQDAHERQLGGGPECLVRLSCSVSLIGGSRDYHFGRTFEQNGMEDSRRTRNRQGHKLVVKQKQFGIPGQYTDASVLCHCHPVPLPCLSECSED